MAVTNVPEGSKPPEEDSREITFICASCQFRTTDEVDFMKHARTEHRSDLSLWCTSCGKCFSNAGVLVSHIKDANCVKEEMIYRCGVKDCTFETETGQTFVHHLRHCHKGSPFIFCVHCQKIFTLPHCLILHMQNECAFKDKNRKNPGEHPSNEGTSSTPAKTVASTPAKVTTSANILPKTPAVKPNVTIEKAGSAYATPTPKGRGKTPARGRSTASKRSRGSRFKDYTDSSDSDDPDDPSWRLDESTNDPSLRRSARWASRVSDAKNPEIEEDGTLVTKKSKGFIDEPSSKIVHCPCCDFSAAFDSLLKDHYVASHKHDKKNACKVCSVKFENLDLFIKHFSQHQKDKELAGKKDSSECSNNSTKIRNVNQAKKGMELDEGDTSDTSLKNVQRKNLPTVLDKTKIPYQAGVNDVTQNDSKVKSFEDLKSKSTISKMLSEPKLKHFFKCTAQSCTYTTDDDKFYLGHLTERHMDTKVHCTYCFQEYIDAQLLVDHMLIEHSKRCYQCSSCFYRAFSKPHVQIHIRNVHKTGKVKVHACSLHLSSKIDLKVEDSNIITTWPYVCATGDCEFKTFDSKEFMEHNYLKHGSVSQFCCHYCKENFTSGKSLLTHCQLHGINNFQCSYCVHGSETREEILLHLCNTHPDKAFKVHVRVPEDADTGNNKTFECSSKNNSMPAATKVPPQPSAAGQKKDLSSLAIKRTNVEYPQEVLCLDKDFFCRMFTCNQECKDFDCYLSHLKEDHNAINILCPYCSVVCTNSTNFENHMMCHGPNLYACPKDKCYFYSVTKDDVVNHMEVSHKLQDGVKIVRENLDSEIASFTIDAELFPKINVDSFYICPFCYYESTDVKHMKNHIYSELIYKRFQCNLCKEKLCSRRDTKSHFSTCHPHHNVKCEINNSSEIELLVKSFLTMNIQKRFMEYLQTSNVDRNNMLSLLEEYKCDLCNLCFYDIADFQCHWSFCLSAANTPYICNHCSEKYSDVTHLKYHTNKEHPGSEINYTLTENVFLKQTTSRKVQVGKLKFFKTLLSPYLKSKGLDDEKLKSLKFESKYYKCAHCNFNDVFQSNIMKHITGCHKEKSPSIEKIKNNDSYLADFKSESSSKKVTVAPADNDADVDMETDSGDEVGLYVCGFCTKKVTELEDLEKHIQTSHKSEDSYPYFYLPDPNWKFSNKNSDLYECAYCSVSKKNLFHLKKHWNNLHADVLFKVRGTRSRSSEAVECEQCNSKVLSEELLEDHCLIFHPKKPAPKKKGGKKQFGSKRKNSSDDVDTSSSKVPKTESENYHCSSCDETFPFYVQMITHHSADHPKLPLKFTKGSAPESTDVSLITCDFCPYAAEQNPMTKHLSTQHKNCFVCAYCGRAFDTSVKIVRHNKTAHKGQPVKLVKVDDSVQGSVGTKAKRPFAVRSNKVKEFSHYGIKPEPVNLDKLTINEIDDVASKTVVNASKIFPIVRVEDFAK